MADRYQKQQQDTHVCINSSTVNEAIGRVDTVHNSSSVLHLDDRGMKLN